MGSQNVTDFSKPRKARIHDFIKDYAAKTLGPEHVWEAATTAIGPLTKSNPFVQSLSSSSVENALDLLIGLYEDFRKSKTPRDVEEVLEEHNVDPKIKRPLLRLTAEMTKSLSDILSARQEESDAAFAAKDAIAKTVIDVLAQSMPRDKVDTATPRQISEAFEKVGQSGVAEVFFKNVLISLMGLSLDASRGKIPRAVVAKIIEDTEKSGLVTGLSQSMVALAPEDPARSPAKLAKIQARTKKKGKVILKPKPPKGDRPDGLIGDGSMRNGKK
jgi:hypothetical protein